VGAGISAAATTTSTKANERTATATASLPSEAPKTMIPAGMAEALPAIEVTAITGTAGPIRDRAVHGSRHHDSSALLSR
jgi:hypothetical protein